MKVGIHNTGYCSAAAIFDQGSILFASQEERLTREKFDNSFPMESIMSGLKQNGRVYDEIDEFCIAWNPFVNAASRFRAGFSRWAATPMQRLHSNPNTILPKFSQNYNEIEVSEQIINYMGGSKKKIKYVNHHLAHIAKSYFSSPFDEAAVMIADGYGETLSTVFAHVINGEERIIKSQKFPHSLGMFYAALTDFLGLRPEMDEWKMMGASSYGNPDKYYDKINSLINIYDNGEFELNLNFFNFYNFDIPKYYTENLIKLLGEPGDGEFSDERQYDIAASVQKVFEEAVIKLLNWFQKETGSTNICLGGGAFMNCLLNGKVTEKTDFNEIFIPFAPDDSGNALGTVMNETRVKTPFMKPYLGNSFSKNTVKTILDRYNLKYREASKDEVNSFAVEKLAEEKVIGWFYGAMEFGQRALGNRSILASAKHSHMKDRVNSAVKNRENYRPFAPAILDEKGSEWFENYAYTPYMEKILRFFPEQGDKVQAVCHADGTGRLQSVRKDFNSNFYDLISSYYELTDIPIIMNTSFNKAGEPIVCSPDDAIKTFYTTGLDYLIIEDFILEK